MGKRKGARGNICCLLHQTDVGRVLVLAFCSVPRSEGRFCDTGVIEAASLAQCGDANTKVLVITPRWSPASPVRVRSFLLEIRDAAVLHHVVGVLDLKQPELPVHRCAGRDPVLIRRGSFLQHGFLLKHSVSRASACFGGYFARKHRTRWAESCM